jgi:hypothetical protein
MRGILYNERKGTLNEYNQEHPSEKQKQPHYIKDMKKETSITK